MAGVAIEMGVTSYYEDRTVHFDPEKCQLLTHPTPHKNQEEF